MYCNCDGKVTFTRYMFDKVTFDKHVNAMERWYICNIYLTHIPNFEALC